MWPFRSVPPYSSVPWTNYLFVPGPFFHGQKSVPMGVPPRMSFLPRDPHVMPSHQSAPWDDSLEHVALLVLAHSALFSLAVQDGQLSGSSRALLDAHCGSRRPAASGLALSPAKGLCKRPVPAKQHR